jgi:hypothetical protein
MNFETSAIFSLTIGTSVIIGWARFYKTDPAFYPFLLLLTIGFINEITSFLLVKNGFANYYNYNIFKLLESLLLTWQFHKWGLFTHSRKLYYSLQGLFFTSWFIETFFHSSIQTFNSYFIITQSAIIVVMSVHMINLIVFNGYNSIIKQPAFLICAALILYFTYSILVEAFWLYGLNKSKPFRLKIFEIMAYVNVTCNLIFTIAFLWIPLRPRYIMRC